jgi:hypothetical protein
MPALNTIKVGDVLYEVYRRKMGNTTMSCTTYTEHRVLEVDAATGRIRCTGSARHGSDGRWYHGLYFTRWRRSPPRCDDPFKSKEERAKIDERNGLKPRKPK